MLQKMLEYSATNHSLQDKSVVLCKQANDTSLTVGRSAFSEDLLALIGQLVSCNAGIFASSSKFQSIETMLEYSVPICFIEHLNKVVFKCIWTFRD